VQTIISPVQPDNPQRGEKGGNGAAQAHRGVKIDPEIEVVAAHAAWSITAAPVSGERRASGVSSPTACLQIAGSSTAGA
jgi:hypothetical protein